MRVLLHREQMEFQRFRHRAGNFILHLEDVIDVALVRLGPQMLAGIRSDQLRRDPQSVAGPSNTAFEDVRYVEFCRDGGDIVRLSSKGKRRGAGNDVQLWRLRQEVEELLGEAVGEVSLFL